MSVFHMYTSLVHTIINVSGKQLLSFKIKKKNKSNNRDIN